MAFALKVDAHAIVTSDVRDFSRYRPADGRTFQIL